MHRRFGRFERVALKAATVLGAVSLAIGGLMVLLTFAHAEPTSDRLVDPDEAPPTQQLASPSLEAGALRATVLPTFGSIGRAMRISLAVMGAGAFCAAAIGAALFAFAGTNRAAAAVIATPFASSSSFIKLDEVLSPPTAIGPLRALSPAPSRRRAAHVVKKKPALKHPYDAQASGDPRPISPGILAALIHACAPSVNPVTQAAVISVESSGDAWSLHDDNDGRVYRPRSFRDAVHFANQLISFNRRRYGSSDAGVDVGVGQINSNNFASLGVDTGWMLHPCPNLRVSSMMIAQAYNDQYARLSTVPAPMRDQIAIRKALQVYNSGRPSGDDAYVEDVLGALRSKLVAQIEISGILKHGLTMPPLRRSQPRVQAHAPYRDMPSTGMFVHEDPFMSHDSQRVPVPSPAASLQANPAATSEEGSATSPPSPASATTEGSP